MSFIDRLAEEKKDSKDESKDSEEESKKEQEEDTKREFKDTQQEVMFDLKLKTDEVLKFKELQKKNKVWWNVITKQVRQPFLIRYQLPQNP